MLINTETNQYTNPIFSKVERVSDADEFSFDWKTELSKTESEVWRLRTSTFSGTLAYLSLSYDQKYSFTIVNLMERRKWNSTKPYKHVGETLMAFACLQSVVHGFDGVVTFNAKSKLINYYQTYMYAQRIGNSTKMVILENNALRLIQEYL